jgi:hypothetical protein
LASGSAPLSKFFGGDSGIVASLTKAKIFMTIVIAAHSLPKEGQGIWFSADSMISRDRPVLCEYKKIYEVDARINAPRFHVHSITSFDEVLYKHPVVVAFAGDLAAAHHILNQISSHLESLIAYLDGDGNPTLSMECAFDSESALRTHFHPHDYPNYSPACKLLTADFIAGVIKHAFNLAVQSGRRYKLNEEEIRNLIAEVVVGLQCPIKKTFHLLRFTPSFNPPSYLPEVTVTEIQPGQAVTIGVPNQEAGAQSCLDHARASDKNIGDSLFSHLVSLVDEGSIASIGHPCVLKKLTGGGLKVVKKTGLSIGAGAANPKLLGVDHIRL